MQFDVAGAGDVVLSLPAWTPGADEMPWFAKWVSSFTPTAGSKERRWANFAFFNGTNVLLYPEGRGFTLPATVHTTTEPDWRVATGMHPAPGGGYTEKNYHDLVDMPFFAGTFDYDSAMAGNLNVRLATYPAGTLTGTAREAFRADYRRMFAPQAALPYRPLFAGGYRAGLGGIGDGSRNVPRLQREAAPAGRHGALPL